MDDTRWETTARKILEQAIRENRSGELLTCLYEGGAATVQPGKGLVLIDQTTVHQLATQPNPPSL